MNKKGVKYGHVRTDREFDETMKEIQRLRMKKYGENTSIRRLSKSAARILRRDEITNEIVNAKLDDDTLARGRKAKYGKKGQSGSMFDIFVFIILAFIVVVFFALFKFGFGIISNTMTTIPDTNNSLNLSVATAAQQTFGVVNNALNGLHTVAFFLLFGMVLSIFLHSFAVRKHPAFFILYFFITVIAVIVSFYVSNAYQTLTANPTIGPALTEFTGASMIINYLPIWVLVVGMFGTVFLLVGINQTPKEGGY